MSTKMGRLYIDKKPHTTTLFPLLQNLKKQLISEGVKKDRIEIHYPNYPGMIQCYKCQKWHNRPYLFINKGEEFWRCTGCNIENYLKKD